MNKTQLIENLSKFGGTTKKESKEFLDAFIHVVTKALKKGDSVQIVGFGKFEIKYRKPRKTYNPLTHQMMHLKASSTPSFRAGKSLKVAVSS